MTIETRIATAKSYPKVAAIINSIQDILEARYGPVHNMEMIRNLVGRFVSDTERAHCIGKLDKLKTFENVAKSVIGRAKSIGYLLVPDGAKPLPLGSKPTMSRDKNKNGTSSRCLLRLRTLPATSSSTWTLRTRTL